LFGPGEGNKMSFEPEIWNENEKLSIYDNLSLDEPFSEKESKEALDLMATNKAPRPNGIPVVEFYQACWPLIKKRYSFSIQ
jgi:hypothetical protein